MEVVDPTIQGCIERAEISHGPNETKVLTVEGWFFNQLEPMVALQLAIPGSQMVLALQNLKDEKLQSIKNSSAENSIFKASIPIPSDADSLALVHFLATLADGVTVAGGLKLPDSITIQQSTEKKDLTISASDLDLIKRNHTRIQKIKLKEFLANNRKIIFDSCDDPEVSIVVPLYNQAELTLECLCSLLNLEGVSFEVVLVDNASEDSTLQLLNQVMGAQIVRNKKNLHFINACNQGAEIAKGRNILFLNSDTWVDPSALKHAINCLNSHDKIGAVGARILGLHGRVQEAGSIIHSDASTCGYGRELSAEHPAVMFRRDVDYVSGSFLLTRRELFLTTGKFDQSLCPAYYEDVDYCTRLWGLGYRVAYEPLALIQHYEHASASSDIAVELQRRNREKFLLKHTLASFTQRAVDSTILDKRFVASGVKRKKLLVIDDQIPLNFKGSGFPRSNRILQTLVDLNYQVTFLPMNPVVESWQEIHCGLSPNIEIASGFGALGIEKILNERKYYYDVLMVSRSHNMQILNELKKLNLSLRFPDKIIYDAEAITALRELGKLTCTKNIQATIEQKRYVINKEVEVGKGADLIFAVSQLEASMLKSFGCKNVEVLSHAIKLAENPAGFESRNGILMTGPLYEEDTPNVHGLRWFLQNVMPNLRNINSKKEIVFKHAGMKAQELFQEFSREDIQFLGVVPDLSECYAQAKVFVAPQHFSAGIPLKCIEASAHGVPCVVTEQLAQQLGWQNNIEAMVASSAEDFANKLTLLLNDSELWHRIRERAYQHVKDNYNQTQFKETLQRCIGSTTT